MAHRPSMMESYAAAMSPQSRRPARRPFPGYLLAFILLAVVLLASGTGRDVLAVGWSVLTGALEALTLPEATR
jgi:hypothetical protein